MDGEFNPDIVTLSDDDGHEFSFELLDAIETDEARYVALSPVLENPEDLLDDEGELVILRVAEEDGEEFFEEIEDDGEYNSISEAFMERLQDLYEFDGVGEEEEDDGEEN
ncbi:MAG: DUF1292 domain-containing protein [Oscillospiraceae bacterium]|jgi:uncharacterized protein YrzB (UPF0473 family)|nr:DUF1292 domain-containing protein [Oscillospiraceae bacterium]